MNDKTIRVLEFEKIKEKLVALTTSELGKDLAKTLTPSTDYHEVKKRNRETSEAVTFMVKKGSAPIGPIYDLSKHLKIAEIGSYLYPVQLLEVSDTLRTARILKGFIKEFEDSDSLLGNYASNLSVLKHIEDRINEAIISEEEISDNASPALKSIRRQIEGKNNAIRNKLNSIISSPSMQKYLQEPIITIRQDRFVIPVKAEYRSSVPGLVHDQSSSGATLFIEPMAVVELNNDLKELKLKEKREIERILTEITGLIKERVTEIRNNQEILSKLDFIFAKARLALEMKAIEPEITNDGFVRIKNGRHPLIDRDKVVPINIWIGDTFNTLLITGPNTGGKTVTLKTVGLFILMMQAGLHVPGDYGTKISIFKQVFADIGDEQSIEQSLSTFSSHMKNIVEIIEKVNEGDIVLLDELGAGTDPTEGAALAMSILTYLYNKGVKTIATTHYSELKEFALSRDGIENASVEFDVETLSPTYRLLIGVPGKSNALEISRRLGLREEIIDGAREFINKEDMEFEDILTSIEDSRRKAERERDEAIKLRLEVERLKKTYEDKVEKIERQREKELREAREEAKRILREAKKEAEEIIKELRSISFNVEKEKNRRIEELRNQLNKNLDSLEEPIFKEVVTDNPPENLKVGDTVIVLNLNQKGIVLTEPNDNGDLTVQVGILKINANISNLKLAKGEEEKSTVKTLYKAKSLNIKKELDIRGLNLEEAREVLDKYLDDAYIAKLEQVTIIHGKGTGVLRTGIHEFLRNHPHVKSFRDGTYGEGGSGVTVVELK